jgi:hypothetical protein
MAKNLIVACGNYSAACAEYDWKIPVYGHTVETEQEIIDKALKFNENMSIWFEENMVIFTNVALFFDGLRLARSRGTIENLMVRFYGKDGTYPLAFPVDRKGRISHWPNGMFDGADKILSELISIK